MKFVAHKQGSEAWIAHRRKTRNASDAPAMMGASPYVTRAELIRQRATGVEREIDDATQAIFDKGHAVEPLLRELAEKLIGEDLYPVTATSDDGYLGASFDGVTLDESIIFEAKQSNAGKIASITDDVIPPADYWQIVQQFAVNACAVSCIYMCGDGTDVGTLRIERKQIEADIPKLLAGWKQFDADVAAYSPEQPSTPTPIGRAPETLPSLRIEAQGMVTASNLAEFRQHALAVLGGINRELVTDDDFANAESTVKWCSAVEDKLAAAKSAVLAQTTSIDEVFRTIDDISAETRRVRLELDKMVKLEKDRRRSEIASAGVKEVLAHYETINSTLGEHAIPVPQTVAMDIGGAIKGLRTLTSIKDAVSTAAASAKIAASQRADAVRASVRALNDAMYGRETLFPDRVALCASKSPEDIRNLVAARIAEHNRREAERKREPVAQQVEQLPSKQTVAGSTPAGLSNERVKLGDINALIAPLTITADGLAQLGFKSVGTERAAKLYAVDDLPQIFGRLENVIVEAAKRDVKSRVAA